MSSPTYGRYGRDVLAGDWRAPRGGRAPSVPATKGLVVEDLETGWCGAVTSVEKSGGLHILTLEDRRGKRKSFRLGPGFLLEGKPVVLTAPEGPAAPTPAKQTASGSVAVHNTKARVAASSRIFVEGRHDAELVEKVWGDDLRIEGVVVELLEGVDDLAGVIRSFDPTQDRRMGVLVDHLVPRTKEYRLVQEAQALPQARWAKILGHPYVDIWESVRPQRLGLERWPQIERGQSWKHAVLAELGWPHRHQADVAQGWKRILGSVNSYKDLEPTLLASVEELIDFVTTPSEGGD